MKLAVGSDEQSELTDTVLSWLADQGHEVVSYGPLTGDNLKWPAVAQQVAESLLRAEVQEGILFCWTGTGVSMAANKVTGIRAALCDDAETARGARLWNNANLLCLSIRRTSVPVALEILQTWFATAYEPNPDDDACLSELAEIDRKNRSTP